MKKVIFPLILIMVCFMYSQPCVSQIDVVLGITKTSITGDESWKDPIGFQAGVIYPVYSINEMISIRAEADLALQGARWEEFDLKGRTNLLYINVPLIVRYLSENGFFAEAGIQPGFLLSARDKYEDVIDNYIDYMNRFDFSIPLGVGYQFENNFSASFRVIPGINDILKESDFTGRNLVFALRGTYTFHLK